MLLSVIICTHNPRENYLRRVLDALQEQTLPVRSWELLLVDNASRQPLAEKWDLSWHPHGRHIREEELGLTPARLRGIQESAGELLIFVDDDNVLDANYLRFTQMIFGDFPFLGAWGGSCLAEFEEQPDPKLTGFLPYLALREISSSHWSNFDAKSVPLGAGMCVRATVAQKYLVEAKKDSARNKLDRRGNSLLGGGDFDLALSSYALGLGTGVFPQLRLNHLIPRHRLEYKYLYRLCVASCYSGRFVMYLHCNEKSSTLGRRNWATDRLIMIAKRIILRQKTSPHEQAAKAGILMAEEDIHRLKLGKPMKWRDTL